MAKKNAVENLEELSMEEKIKMLSENDKAYIRGYIDRAYFEQRAKYDEKKTKKPKNPSNN